MTGVSEHKSFGRRRSLRLPGFDYSEARAYHVTWGTHKRRPVLCREDLALLVVDSLRAEAEHAPADLYAYCVMPDHVHALLAPRDGASVIRLVQSLKSRTTRAYWAHGGTGKLWQRGFYDHIVRRDEDLSRTAEYILGNPVRAGLVADIADYPYAGREDPLWRRSSSPAAFNVADKLRRYGRSRTSHTRCDATGSTAS